MTTDPLAAGRIVGGRITVRRLLGTSAHAATYEALMAPSRELALKVYDSALSIDLEAVRRLAGELDSISTRMVVPIVECGVDEDSGAAFVASELALSPSLATLVGLCPLAAAELVAFTQKLAEAIDAVHARGVVHGALSPTNVFVGSRPRHEVRLADFSLPGVPVEGTWDSAGSDIHAMALLVLFAATAARLEDRSPAALAAPATAIARQTGIAVDARLDAALAPALGLDRPTSASAVAAAVSAALGIPLARTSSAHLRAAVATAPPSEAEAAPAPRGRVTIPVPPPSAVPRPAPLAGVAPPPPLAAPPPSSHGAIPVGGPAFAAPAMVVPQVVHASPESSAPFAPSFEVAPTSRRRGVVAAIAIGVPILVIGGLIFVLLSRPRPTADVNPPVASSAPAHTVAAEPRPSTPAAPTTVPPPTTPTGANGTLVVTCVPACDVVTVDGNPVTTFPATVTAGHHAIVGTRGTHPPQTREVDVAAEDKQSVTFTFYVAAPPPKKQCGKFLERCD